MARRMAGDMVRIFKQQPTVRKWGEREMEARFIVNDCHIVINRFRGAKCVEVEEVIEHPAEPEKVIPAKEAWVEKKIVVKCDVPSWTEEIK